MISFNKRFKILKIVVEVLGDVHRGIDLTNNEEVAPKIENRTCDIQD